MKHLRGNRLRMAGLLAFLTVLGGVATPPANAQVNTVLLPGRAGTSGDGTTRRIPVTGDRLSGFVLPISPQEGAIELRARTANLWRIDDTRRLLLRGDVDVRIGPHRYRAGNAVVWINRLPTDTGLVNQIAVWFDEVRNPERPTSIGVAGRRLLVTGSTVGTIDVDADAIRERRPSNSALLTAAEARLRDHLVTLLPGPDGRVPVDVSPAPRVLAPIAAAPGSPAIDPSVELPEVSARQPWLRAPGASIAFSAERLELDTRPDENVVTATGGFVVEYFADDDATVPSQLTLTAERAVIFTDPGSIQDLARRSLDASFVRGIYLEGDVRAVADRGEQILRSPRVYYDFESGRAIMLDAVLRTYARDVNAPVYARASEMRQIAADQFTATDVNVTASEYAVGHLSLGARQMTITQRPAGLDAPDPADPRAADVSSTYLEADNITLNVGRTPIFFWPGFEGRAQDIPLRGISFGNSDNNGLEIETRWDLLALASAERRNFDAELLVDAYTSRGVGVGTNLRFGGSSPGQLELYYLRDDGEDRTSAGRTVEQDDANRGLALYEQRFRLGRSWELLAQGAYISDPSYIATWRREDFRERREYETGLRLQSQTGDTAFSVETTSRTNDFISNGWLLAGPAYSVERAPEVRLSRIGNTLFNGAVTSFFDARYGRVRAQYETSTPRELGVRQNGFGIGRDDPLSDLVFASGIDQRWVHRADIRQEFALPLDHGPVRIVPFTVLRATIWDDDFSRIAQEEDDSMRIYGAVGVRASTRFQRVYNNVSNVALDLNRLRHIVEPSITAMHAHTDVDQSELPIYDPSVESIAAGSMVAFGLRNRLQTYRGGPGRQRSVDVLDLDTRLVLGSGELDRESPTPRFIDWRPEQSQAGDHIRQAMTWAVSDSVWLTGEGTWDLDDSVLARGSLGVSVQHSPVLTTYLEYRTVDASDTELLDFGWRYRVSPKYRLFVRPTYDFREGDFRTLLLQVTRSFPDFDLRVLLNYDQIRDDTTFGASIGFVTF
ncbi:MAG: LPS assembly protein LptD [Phycisphaerales bacterium]